MDTVELVQALKNVKHFGGVLPADRLGLCQRNKLYIINTDPSDKLGTHWVAVYLCAIPEFFDSVGHHPTFYHEVFEQLLIDFGPNYRYNNKRLQNYGSNTCGQYCIYYVMSRIMGYSLHNIVHRFQCSNLQLNDMNVIKFYKSVLGRN